MGAPYTSVSVSGYNANPPSDDGAENTNNRISWATEKTKLADPLKTAIEAVNSNVSSAFGKVVGGAGVATTAVDYGAGASDQGKLVRVTAASKTVTTPDATSVGSPFVFFVVNGSSGTTTIDGNGAQTVDGAATITLQPGQGVCLFTDGSNWFTTGLGGVLTGAQTGYGQIINGTISESNGTNAATFALKTLAGNDPSATDPVILCFRNATVGTGNYIYRAVTSALSLVLSSGSTLAATNGVAFKVWLVIFDDGGTIRLGAINCLSGVNIYPLGQVPLASSTAEGGAGAADSAHVFYTGTAVTSKPYLILGYAAYESGLAAAGSWNVSPTRLQMFGHGVPLPGDVVQRVRTATGAVATGTTQMVSDDSIPQSGEGDQYMSQAITPTSAANVVRAKYTAQLAFNSVGTIISALFQDAATDALAAIATYIASSNANTQHVLEHSLLSQTTSATTFKMRAGSTGANTVTFNGSNAGRLFGGVFHSFIEVEELMA